MTALGLIVLFLLSFAQVLFLFRVGDIVRRWLRPLIPAQPGIKRELIAGLLFLIMVALVFGAYLFLPLYLMVNAFAWALSIPPATLGQIASVFPFVSFILLGVCIKLWPKRFAFSGLTIRSRRTRAKAARALSPQPLGLKCAYDIF